MRSHHPVEPDHIFPVDVVQRRVVLGCFTQGVDVFPGSPPAGGGVLGEGVILARVPAAHVPHDVDLADDPAHELSDDMNID